MDRRREPTILLDRIAIEDGQIPPPAIGEVIEFPLRFWEYSTSETGTDQHDAMTIHARLEPSGRPPRRFGLADDSESADDAGRDKTSGGVDSCAATAGPRRGTDDGRGPDRWN